MEMARMVQLAREQERERCAMLVVEEFREWPRFPCSRKFMDPEASAFVFAIAEKIRSAA